MVAGDDARVKVDFQRVTAPPGAQEVLLVRHGACDPPATVGDLIWHCLSDPKPKTRYPILRRPFMDRTLPRMMNPRTVDRIIAKRLGFPTRG